jgi:hypothetical protein
VFRDEKQDGEILGNSEQPADQGLRDRDGRGHRTPGTYCSGGKGAGQGRIADRRFARGRNEDGWQHATCPSNSPEAFTVLVAGVALLTLTRTEINSAWLIATGVAIGIVHATLG